MTDTRLTVTRWHSAGIIKSITVVLLPFRFTNIHPAQRPIRQNHKDPSTPGNKVAETGKLLRQTVAGNKFVAWCGQALRHIEQDLHQSTAEQNKSSSVAVAKKADCTVYDVRYSCETEPPKI